MTETKCAHCGAPTSSGVILCKGTQQTARSALENIATYHGELLGIGAAVRIRTKRSGVSDPTGSTAASEADHDESTLPADVAAGAKNALVGWMRCLNDDRGVDFPADTVLALARCLERHLGSIATLEWGANFVREILALEQRMRRIIERSKGTWYAGICGAIIEPERAHNGATCACACHNGLDVPCDIDGGCGSEFRTISGVMCEAELFATPGRYVVRCTKCRSVHPVSERRATLIAEMREKELSLATIARVCVAMFDEEPSVDKFRKRLDKWTDRGDLVWSGHKDGVRLYRVGDVLDLQVEHANDPRGWNKRRAVG